MSQAQGGTEQVITFCELPRDHTHACARTHTHKREQKTPEISSSEGIRCERKKKYGSALLLLVTSLRKCLIKGTSKGALPNSWDIVCRDVE